MTKRDAKPLKVLIRQLRKNVDLYTLFGKPIGVLGNAELFEPVRNLLHRGHRGPVGTCPRFWITATRRLYRLVRDSTRPYRDFRSRVQPPERRSIRKIPLSYLRISGDFFVFPERVLAAPLRFLRHASLQSVAPQRSHFDLAELSAKVSRSDGRPLAGWTPAMRGIHRRL
jgi:hypothetical protein